MIDVVIGHNPLVNRALQAKGIREMGVSELLEMARGSRPETPLGKDMRVYFSGGYPFGSQAVRERPADVCSAIGSSCAAIDLCHYAGVKKMIFLASACIYPPSLHPLREDSITGIVAPLNEPAAWPRLLAMKQCQFYRKQYGDNFVIAVPATAYGPGDDFDSSGHALPVLMKKMHELKMSGGGELTCQGSGRVTREWIYADDLADGLICVMEKYNELEPINIGVGYDLSMDDLLSALQCVVGMEKWLEIIWDSAISPGVQRQVLASEKIFNLGWKPQILLRDGLEKTYEWFKDSVAGAAGQPQRPT